MLTDGTREAWVAHAQGAAQIIQYRGPGCFTSEFDKTLLRTQMHLLAQMPPLVRSTPSRSDDAHA